jgi:hypothetical protein
VLPKPSRGISARATAWRRVVGVRVRTVAPAHRCRVRGPRMGFGRHDQGGYERKLLVRRA